MWHPVVSSMVVSAAMNAVSVVIAGGYYLCAHNSGTLAPSRDSEKFSVYWKIGSVVL
ncbi:hypothetical protein BDR03DRAFT_972515 [Suillus americanus]|nr:hypothetical protein BDR03DRAFT_972515 [Suillus americanus]